MNTPTVFQFDSRNRVAGARTVVTPVDGDEAAMFVAQGWCQVTPTHWVDFESTGSRMAAVIDVTGRTERQVPRGGRGFRAQVTCAETGRTWGGWVEGWTN